MAENFDMELKEVMGNIHNRLSLKENHVANLESFMENLPGGIMRCNFDEKLTITYVSEGFEKLFGYSKQEIAELFDNSFFAMIYPDDRAPALEACNVQLKDKNTKKIEYRVRKKDGKLIWIWDCGQIVKDSEGQLVFYCILMDNTESKVTQEKLRLSLEQYEIVFNQTSDIIFQTDYIKGDFIVSDNWAKKFEFDPPKKQIEKFIQDTSLIFEEDRHNLETETSKIIKGGAENIDVEFRMKNLMDGGYNWFKVRATAQKNDKNEFLGVIGVITDIDSEKKNMEKLIDKAEKDPLTKLYNKEMFPIIVDNIFAANPRGESAFLIIDLDNFKNINDLYGHIYGDKFLCNFSDGLREIFDNGEILARIGGDEFAVFITDGEDEKLIEKKARKILEMCEGIEHAKNSGVSCCVGVVLTPDYGNTFQVAYKNSDIALYIAKKTGKHNVVFYKDEYALEDENNSENRLMPCDREMDFKNKIADYIFELLYNNTDNILEIIPKILEILGKKYDVSRTYIFENDENDTFTYNTFEWCSDGEKPQMSNLQKINFEAIDNYYDNFNDNGVFYSADVRNLHYSQRKILEQQNIKSVLQCAIYDKGKCKGMIGFDECRKRRQWTSEQISTLSLVTKIIGVFLLQERAKKLTAMTLSGMEELLDKQVAWIYVIDCNTFELLYLNKKTRAIAPFKENATCYKTFFNADKPCDNCPAKNANKQNGFTQLRYSQLLQNDFTAEVYFMPWRNRTNCCVVIGKDIVK